MPAKNLVFSPAVAAKSPGESRTGRPREAGTVGENEGTDGDTGRIPEIGNADERMSLDAKHIPCYDLPWGGTMADHADSERTNRSQAAASRPSEANGLDGVESYEVDGGVVFYDPQNPLAWVETSQTFELKDCL